MTDARDRGQEHDARQLVLGTGNLQQRHRLLGSQPEAAHIDREKVVEILDLHRVERADAQQARRADEAVEFAVALAYSCHRGLDARLRLHVADLGLDACAVAGEILAQKGEILFRDIERDDGPAVIEESLRRAAPDARCTTRYRCDFGHSV